MMKQGQETPQEAVPFVKPREAVKLNVACGGTF
jgi:hypothetical protein